MKDTHFCLVRELMIIKPFFSQNNSYVLIKHMNVYNNWKVTNLYLCNGLGIQLKAIKPPPPLPLPLPKCGLHDVY
jgi:hypothetical protein